MTADGKSFAAKARELGADVIYFWNDLWRDETAPFPIRLRASELIVERGFGKAQQNITVSAERPISSYTREELEAIAFSGAPQVEQTEDNVIDVEFTAQSTTSAET